MLVHVWCVPVWHWPSVPKEYVVWYLYSKYSETQESILVGEWQFQLVQILDKSPRHESVGPWQLFFLYANEKEEAVGWWITTGSWKQFQCLCSCLEFVKRREKKPLRPPRLWRWAWTYRAGNTNIPSRLMLLAWSPLYAMSILMYSLLYSTVSSKLIHFLCSVLYGFCFLPGILRIP